jgi:hypothetical protein
MTLDRIDDKEWRQLCQLAAGEHDPERLSEIVDQLLRALDARRRALNLEEQRRSASHPAGADN